MGDEPVPSLSSLGERIMVCGTSNTGKSTLAVAIGETLGLPVVHLDRLRFLPNTDWQERPDAEFAALHAEAIAEERWIIEGNYSVLTSGRLERATGIILLSDNRFANFARYLRRTVFQRVRLGSLEGNRDSLKWDMVSWVLVRAPRNIAHYRTRLSRAGLPYLEVRSIRALRALYRYWGLPELWRQRA